jgi:hypothetical protein
VTSILGFILTGVEGFGTLCLWAIEQGINAILIALVAAWNAALSLLPGMGTSPALGNPQWLGWLNWAYPIGALVAGLTTVVGIWSLFLVVRYVLRLIRAV